MSESTFQLPVLAVKEALPGLSKVINRRSGLPVRGCVKINRLATGQLSFEGTDLDALAIYTTEAEKGGKDLSVLLPFDELSNLLKGCPKSSFMQVTVNEKDATLRYPVGGTWLEKRISTIKESEWPVIPRLQTQSAMLPVEFQKNLLTAFDCASDYKPNLTGAWLDVNDPKAHYVVGADGHQLFAANSFKFDLKESLLLPRHRFLHWPGFYEDGEWELRVGQLDKEGNGWTQIQSACWTLLVKQTRATCPHWKQVIPAAVATHVTFSNEAVGGLLDLLPKLPGASKLHHDVTFDLGARGTFVGGSENGHSFELLVQGVRIVGKPNTFTADRTLIIKALKIGLKDLAIVDGLTPLVFSDATRKLVIAPLRADPIAKTSAPAPVQPPAASASEPSTHNPQEEGNTVRTTNRINPAETSEINGDSSNRLEPQEETASALKQAIEKVDQIKESLRGVITDLNDVLKALNQAQRDKRASEKEVEEVREALQSLQRIRI